MFKINGFGQEIYKSMEQKLASNQTEVEHGFGKLSKAVDYLSAAAEVFEKAGMVKEAEEVVEVLQSLTKRLSK